MTFPQNSFFCHLWRSFELLCKTQKCIYLRKGARYSNFSKIFGPKGTRRAIWRLFPKIVFPPFLLAILNFCVRHKKAFILEGVQDRAISVKFLSPRVSAESSGDIFQKNRYLVYFGIMVYFCILNF